MCVLSFKFLDILAGKNTSCGMTWLGKGTSKVRERKGNTTKNISRENDEEKFCCYMENFPHFLFYNHFSNPYIFLALFCFVFNLPVFFTSVETKMESWVWLK